MEMSSNAPANPRVAGRPERFAGVLFDCDGVLVDSEIITNGTLREMLHELGWQISEEEGFRMFIGRALVDEAQVIFDHTGFWIDDAWLAQFRQRRYDRLRESVEALPGARAAVTAMADRFGGQIACASGADRAKIEMQLAATDLAELFGDRVFSGMEQPRSKPAPDVYLAAAKALGIDAVDALVVEDTVAGVTAGVAAGATVIGLSAGGPASSSPEELRAAGAVRVMEHMSELSDIVDDLTARAAA